ncbi:PIN domain-containing protein [Algoriphagus aestuarii]|nr:PIN domain-containing protein [Algoriphagus aestuarii]
MPVGISRLTEEIPSPDKKYFLDANVWIFALGNPSSNSNGQEYIDFLDNLLANEMEIYSHTILISEVFNALMRITFKDFVRIKEYQAGKSLHLDFKKDFRQTEEYLQAFKRFQSDIEAYLPFIRIIDKEYEYEMSYLIKNLPPTSDFNDYLYYEMAVDLGLVIVTDDKDFNYDGIEILTENRALLNN